MFITRQEPRPASALVTHPLAIQLPANIWPESNRWAPLYRVQRMTAMHHATGSYCLAMASSHACRKRATASGGMGAVIIWRYCMHSGSSGFATSGMWAGWTGRTAHAINSRWTNSKVIHVSTRMDNSHFGNNCQSTQSDRPRFSRFGGHRPHCASPPCESVTRIERRLSGWTWMTPLPGTSISDIMNSASAVMNGMIQISTLLPTLPRIL